MPGMAPWKELYRLEHEMMLGEGFDLSNALPPAPHAPECELQQLPRSEAEAIEAKWEAAYEQLVALREQGLAPACPYVEPDEWEEITAVSPLPPKLEPLTREALEDRIHAAWQGRCAGLMLGKPVEMWPRQELETYLRNQQVWPLDDYIPWPADPEDPACERFPLRSAKACTRGNIHQVEIDDDTSYTVNGLCLIEQHGRDFTPLKLCRHWLAMIPYNRIYSCTRQAYWHLVMADPARPLEEVIPHLRYDRNPMREGLNAAIRADIHGYISPGDPRKAGCLAHREASVNSAKNGIYAATFVAGCIAGALSARPSVDSILASGLANVPRQSRLREIVDRTRDWYETSQGDWQSVCQKVYETYGHLNWMGVMYNYPLVVLALLHGQMDFTRTISTAVMCGVDTDSNAATVGSIIGAALGTKGIDRRWTEPLNDKIVTFLAANGYGDGTISDCARRTLRLIPEDNEA